MSLLATKDSMCRVCKTKCDIIKLVDNMNHEVKDFFSDPDILLTKIQKIIDFQASHRKRVTAYRMTIEKKYKEAQKEMKRLMKVLEFMYEDLSEAKKENNELKAKLAFIVENKKPAHSSSSLFGPHFNSPEAFRQSQMSHSSKRQGKSGCHKIPSTLLTPSPSNSCKTFLGFN